MANIKVAVRVRPISQKEAWAGGRHVVHVQDNTVSITNIKVPVTAEGTADHRERIRHFVYDFTYGHDHGISEAGGQGDEASPKVRAKSKRDAKRPSAGRRTTSRKDSKTGDRGTKGSSSSRRVEQKGSRSVTQTDDEHGVEAKGEDQDEAKIEHATDRKEAHGEQSDVRQSEETRDATLHKETRNANQDQETRDANQDQETRDTNLDQETRDANLDQERVYRELGREVEEATLYGYNACMLAYGQSGSGKTYTILGHKEAPGLAPRICQGLLTRLQERYSPDDLCAQDFSLTLSLVEIYNERVLDLLTASDPGRSLRVREHPHTGPYVDGVTRHPVTDVGVAWSLLERGRASRSVAPTASHAHSSRSHALLTLDVTQPAAHTRSTLTLVDLAGSERASEEVDKTRLTEGASINRSLVTLGNVISALGMMVWYCLT